MIISALYSGLFLLAAGHDVFTRRIPNWLCLSGCILILGAALIFDLDPRAIVSRILGGVGMVIIWFFIWRLGLIGGGDHKLLILSGLAVGAGQILNVSILTAFSGGLLAVIMIVVKILSVYRVSGCLVWPAKMVIPYGLAIAFATIFILIIELALHPNA